MVAIPKIIVVRNSSGEILRERRGLFDSKGNLRELTQISGATSAVTSLEYDAAGSLIFVMGPPNTNGQRYTVHYTYDAVVSTYVEGTRDAFGYTSYARYDYRYGVPTTTTDTNRNSTIYTYDGAGRLDTVTGPYDMGRSATISVKYYAAQTSNGVITSPASSRVENKGYYASEETIDTQTFADGLGRIIQTKKSASIQGASRMSVSGAVEFDIMGRVVKQGQPIAGDDSPSYAPTAMSALHTKTEYDPAGRQKRITSPDGSSVNIAYGFEENRFMTKVTDRMGKEKRTLKDIGGSITAVKEVLDGGDITTRYKYNALNEITRVTDHSGNITQIKYDMLGRRTEIDNPDAGRVQYIYDTAGNMVRKITPNLRKITKSINYKYEFNRLTRIDYPAGADVTYEYGSPGGAYNTAGRIKKVALADLTFTETFGYGRLGETVRSTRTIKDTAGKLTTATTLFEFDSMGRMQSLVYPDGDRLVYTYDSGGLLASAYSTSKGATYTFIKKILYDEYGQRTEAEYGNNTKTTYQYDPETRYLTALKTVNEAGKVYQNLSYEYDLEGNILKRENNDFYTDDVEAKRSTQTYEYDDLHRLVGSTGSYNKETWLPYYKERVNTYTNNIQYSPIGNILRKEQINKADYPDTGMQNITATTYDNTYEYTSHKPHAVTKAGTKLFSYDDNGNMTRTTDSSNNFSRDLTWDEENRLMKTVDTNGTTTYRYDPSGNRTIKSGKFGEVVYVNPNYTVRNGDVISKHVFAGNSRVASKLEMKDKQGKVDETGIYYTHNDHLGSSAAVTDKQGNFYEGIEFFPQGCVWVHDKTENTNNLPYRHSTAEIDSETGLYYHGARYRDPVAGVWTSVDPIIGDYLPVAPINDKAKKYNENLPGLGGVFNTVNLNLYHYAGNNPIKYIDPDGKETWIFALKEVNITLLLGGRWQSGVIIDENMDVWAFTGINFTIGANLGIGPNVMYSTAKTGDEYLKSQYITLEGGMGSFSGEVGCANTSRGVDWTFGGGVGKSFLDKLIKNVKIGGNFNFVTESTASMKPVKLTDPKLILNVLNKMKESGMEHQMIDKAIKHYEKNSKNSKQ